MKTIRLETVDGAAEVFATDEIVGPTAGVCRICGCTDDDCSGCIERTGTPCHWVEPDLCSACAQEDHERRFALRALASTERSIASGIAGFIRYRVIGRTVCFFRGHRRGATFNIGDVWTSVCDRCLRRERT